MVEYSLTTGIETGTFAELVIAVVIGMVVIVQ